MFRIGYLYLGLLTVELLVYVLYTIKIAAKFKKQLSKLSVTIITSIFLALLAKTLLYLGLRVAIGDSIVGEIDNADLYYYLVFTIVYCIDVYLFLIFVYMIFQMYKMRAMLETDSEEELMCKITRMDRRQTVFMVSYLILSAILIASWSFIMLSDDEQAQRLQEEMKYCFIAFYSACIIAGVLDIYVMIKFLSICHNYAMLYYKRNRCLKCIFFLGEVLAFLLFVFNKIGKDTLFPIKHTE